MTQGPRDDNGHRPTCPLCEGSGQVRGVIDRIKPVHTMRRADLTPQRMFPVDDWTPDHREDTP